MGGWAAEDVKRLVGHATSLTTMAPLFFYAGLMLGRGVVPFALKRVREIGVVLTALVLAVAYEDQPRWIRVRLARRLTRVQLEHEAHW